LPWADAILALAAGKREGWHERNLADPEDVKKLAQKPRAAGPGRRRAISRAVVCCTAVLAFCLAGRPGAAAGTR